MFYNTVIKHIFLIDHDRFEIEKIIFAFCHSIKILKV